MGAIISTVVIAVLIAAYVGFVIYRYIKRAKSGQFCGCGCDKCAYKSAECGTDKKDAK